MIVIASSHLSDAHKQDVRELWNSEYPAQLAHADTAAFDAYLDGLTDKRHYLLMSTANAVMGWAMTFSRDDKKWFALIVQGGKQGRGHGTRILDVLKKKEPILHGWVTHHNNYTKGNGTTYLSPLGFYLKSGFFATGVKLDTEQLSAVEIQWQRDED